MKCPKCGSARCYYVTSRKKHWKKAKSAKAMEPRKDFRVKCKSCGYEGVVKP